ncbi:hypothetical protein BSKO_00039 [Bryopsis sp. KO-2023]|nr:hypothetical protein BSKO_00039 [Bryopsis sp. KO-2023]
MSYRAGRAASALKSGVVYSGSAIFNGVNAITPHLAGAVDIMVVKQPDGSLKSSPFYVRFGKYTSYRTRDRTVSISVNGEETVLQMHLGSYGQAYFVAEYSEVYSGSEEEAALSGMISPPSGYSSGEIDTPYANADLVDSVRTEIDLLRKEEEQTITVESTQTVMAEGETMGNVEGSIPDSSSNCESDRELSSIRLDMPEGPEEALLMGVARDPSQSVEEHGDDADVGASNTPSQSAPHSPFAPGLHNPQECSERGFECLEEGLSTRFDVEVEEIRISSTLMKGECSALDLVSAGEAFEETCLTAVREEDTRMLRLATSSTSIEFPYLDARGSSINDFGPSKDSQADLEIPEEAVFDDNTQFLGSSMEVLETSQSEQFVVNVARSTSSQIECEPNHHVSRTHSAPVDIGTEDGDSSTKRRLALKLPGEVDAAPSDGYLGDSDQPTTGFASPTSAAEQRMEGLEGLREFQLSLCGHLLRRDMLPAEAQAAFEENMIHKDQFALCGLTLCKSPDLVCRIGGTLYPWNAAAPMVLGMLAFGGNWDSLIQDGSRYSVGGSPISKGSPLARKVSGGWRLWPFGSWRGRPVNKSGDLSPIDTEIPPSPTDPDRFGNAPEPNDPFMTHPPSNLRYKSSRKKHRVVTKKTLNPTSDQLGVLNLKNGRNVIEFHIGSNIRIQAYIYMINWMSRLVISDIDGTVTRSDLLGHLLPPIGVDWTHSGVAHLFSDITANGYEIMFLSSRAIAQANVTRDFLHSLEQGEHKMPLGPVIISPHGLLPSLYREMILRRPHDFKIGCLQDIRILFPDDWNPFYAGFGNRGTDVLSYEKAGVPPSRIFTINSKGQIIRGSLSSIQTSTWSSLQGINELVDEVFPPVKSNRQGPPLREEFNDFCHWKVSIPHFGLDDPELGDMCSHPEGEEHAKELHTPGHLAQSLLNS